MRGTRRLGTALISAAVLLAAVLFSAGVAGAEESSPGPSGGCPPTSPAPIATAAFADSSVARFRAPTGTLVACVATMSITATTFNHWAIVAERSASRQRVAEHELIDEVMGFLVSSDWVIGEAADLGINVTEAQVIHRYHKIRDQQFPHPREFVRFLRSSGETVADLLFRVRLNMLSRAEQQHVLKAAQGRNEGSGAAALVKFIKAFRKKWTAQTYCAAAFSIADCGHTQPL